MAKEEIYVVRRAFPSYGGIPGDTGAVFPLGGYVNDEKLIRLGFLEKLDTRAYSALATCGVCGLRFVSGKHRDAHGDRQHRPAVDYEALAVEQAGNMIEALPHYSLTGIEGSIVPDTTGDAEERRLER